MTKKLTKPDCPNYEAWQGYMATRKEKKYPVNPYAINRLVCRLIRFMREGQDITRMLDQSTVAGWNTIYIVKGYVRCEEKPVQARESRTGKTLSFREVAKRLSKKGKVGK